MSNPRLPNFNGVGPSKVYLPAGPYTTVLDFLEKRFSRGTRDGWSQRMRAGRVINHEGLPLPPDAPYLPHSRIYYYREQTENFVIPFQEEIIYEDEHLLVADKPHFLPVTPVGPYIQETLMVRLRNRTGLEHLSAVHRLDLETAGLVIFTKQLHTRNLYAELFRKRQVVKTYLAVAAYSDKHTWPKLCRSRIESSARFMQMHEVQGVDNAITQVQMLTRQESHALYQLSPQTGKKHQLRVHMNALGIPIYHDQIYPFMQTYIAPEHRQYDKPLQLLAHKLAFVDPLSGHSHLLTSRLTLAFPVAS